MYLAILAVLIIAFIVYPIVKQKFTERQERKKEAEAKGLKKVPPKKKISDRNGTQQDVSEFISRLISFARRNKVRTIIPATVTYKGEEARITAIIVGHGRAMGIFCLGYGGSVQPDFNSDEWRQELKGEIKYFKNPLKITEGMDELVRAALTDAGFDIPFKTVCVFTTPNVDVTPVIQDVYTDKGFFYYLDNTDWVAKGDMDMNAVANAILSYVPMEQIRQAQKDQEQQQKEQQEEEKAAEKEARREAREKNRENRKNKIEKTERENKEE